MILMIWEAFSLTAECASFGYTHNDGNARILYLTLCFVTFVHAHLVGLARCLAFGANR